ncbi:EF-hand domain-containing family member C2-like [Sycon ciliatum]|uniref:EF-hand domain-containing family member C2-like n=1 Tax=Sycon ciliatum TaxID=27933 RepID=UPI0020AD5E85|eukprot:scpid12580/ scgid20790/ EF-hand domain-containing family member C2
MALPFLPGNQFNPKLGSERFHKSHCFDYNNQVSGYVGFNKSGIGGDRLPGAAPPPEFSKFPTGKGGSQPSWVAFDRQVLRFYAYCQEPVHEKREERSRTRRVQIYFFLEDDTIRVVEPKQKNSALPQGDIIRRHRIPRPSPADGTFYTLDDFNVGRELSLYAKSFKLAACDQFTRNFLTKIGKTVPEDDGVPTDEYTEHRTAMAESMQPMRPYERYDTLKQFLDNDRKVLRFYGIWDDTNNMFGEVREMVLHYHLADDTVELLEVYKANCQRDTIPIYLHRVQLPKEPHTVPQPGQTVSRTILNVFGPMGHGGRHILDNLKTGVEPVEYYHHSDLAIGRSVNVFGRRLLLCDADGFTRKFYGAESEESIDYRMERSEAPPRPLPPHNDYGTLEDSLANCKNLVPKKPKGDFVKFYEKDRHGLDGHVLRFLARLETKLPIDKDRRFVISVFLSDDTVAVFEPPQRNSGVIGGNYLSRGRVENPDKEPDPITSHPQFYLPEDFAVGRVIVMNKHSFSLLDADDYVFKYMEENAHEFQQSDIGSIVATIRAEAMEREDAFRSSFEEGLHSGDSKMESAEFTAILANLVPRLIGHEVMTVARYYSDPKATGVAVETVAATAQEQLKKVNFESFARLLDIFRYEDEARSGHLPRSDVRRLCMSFKVPLTKEVLGTLLDRCPRNEQDELNYEALVDAINWRQKPRPAGSNEAATTQHALASFAYPEPSAGQSTPSAVSYDRFLRDLFGG